MPKKSTDSLQELKKEFVEEMREDREHLKTKLILVIVANTNDPTIGKGCEVDINTIHQMFEDLSRQMNFNFIDLVIKGNDYGKENVLKTIDTIEPGPNDIVVFYYSGHGFSYEKDKNVVYPQIDLRTDPANTQIDFINNNTENLSDIFIKVKGRGARLNIVIGDCCNTAIKYPRAFKGGSEQERKALPPPKEVDKKIAEALFCDLTASILVGAAERGQYAITDEAIGSIFTHNFANHLKVVLDKSIETAVFDGVPWKKILDDTKEKTLALSKTYDIGDGKPGKQEAIIEIESRISLY
jgi:hypothetical protein